jgi:hypothetical protein
MKSWQYGGHFSKLIFRSFLCLFFLFSNGSVAAL